LSSSGLTRPTCGLFFTSALSQPYKHIIHPFRDFVKGFFEKISKKLKVKTRFNPEKRAATHARGTPKIKPRFNKNFWQKIEGRFNNPPSVKERL
jgi:hypothetical protein